MKSKQKRLMMSWIMVLMILISTFSPMNTVFAQENTTDPAAFSEPQSDMQQNASGDIKDGVDEGDPAGSPDGGETANEPDEDGPLTSPGKGETDKEDEKAIGPLGEEPPPSVPKDVTELLKNLEFEAAVVLLDENDEEGQEIGDGDTIDSSSKIRVKFSFRVPVKGDGEFGDEIVHQNDYATFELTDAFRIESTVSIPLYDGDTQVATVTFKTDEETGMVTAHVVFDGEEKVFTGAEGESGVYCKFQATLAYNTEDESGQEGDHQVTVLEKTFIVNVPPAEIIYTVEKSGTVSVADKTVSWQVIIHATQDGNPIDLAGYQFVDDLNSVGEYKTGSFDVTDDNDDSVFKQEQLTYTDNTLRYTFPEDSISPLTITFKTEIPEEQYYAESDKQQEINNTAWLEKEDLEPQEGSATAKFTPPTWIKKTGTLGGEDANGTYNPKDRTITWHIEANHAGAVLENVVITDLLPTQPAGLSFKKAYWQKWNGTDWEQEDSLLDEQKWSLEPSNGEYELGSINTKVRLTIVTKVADEDYTTGKKTYVNSATIRWDDMPVDPIGSGDVGVDVGYDAIEKTGEQLAPETRQIQWTVTVKPKGQGIGSLKVYDLLVYGEKTDIDIMAEDIIWPDDLDVNDLTPQYGQRYVMGSFERGTNSGNLAIKVHTIRQGGEPIADLLEVTGFSGTDENSFTFKSQVLDPDIFAGNKEQGVYNTATLFKGSKKLIDATGDVPYNSSVLAKEMLHRDEAAKFIDAIHANRVVSGAAEGFHHIKKAVVFRLNINADNLNFNDMGKAIITDTLPAGWELVPFYADEEDQVGKSFLIYEAAKDENGKLAAKGAPLDSVAGLTIAHSTTEDGKQQTISFTFDPLDKPYVILVKARPDADTLAGYLKANNAAGTTKANKLDLEAGDWKLEPSVTRTVTIKSQVLSKTLPDDPEQGILKWTVEYKPQGLEIGKKIVDKLPVGLDLRISPNGQLLLEGNITAHEMTLNPNGSYAVGDPVTLKQSGDDANILYNTKSRELTFIFPNPNKAYQLTYITDITGNPGEVTNEVNLLGGGTSEIETSKPFTISQQDGSATMQRSGWLEITKTDKNKAPLAGAEFTLFALDGETVIRRGTGGTDGKITLRGIPVGGTYILRETKAPSDEYALEGIDHMVTVTLVGGKPVTSIDSRTGADGNQLTVKNFKTDDPVGRLTIRKTVAGNDGSFTQKFGFTVTFEDVPQDAEFPYTGAGVPGGNIKSEGTIWLAHGESVTITGLPAGIGYVVAEQPAEGYVTESIGAEGTIEDGQTKAAVFTNTKNKPGDLTISKTVVGGGGDPARQFEFTVAFPDLGAGQSFAYTKGGQPAGTIQSGGKILLTDGESITITGLPAGTRYVVTEKDYSGEGYITECAGGEGTIETIVGASAAFTNHVPGKLTIRKTVEGNAGSLTKKFDFTVTFEDVPQDAEFPYTGVGVPDGTIKSGGTIALAHGQSITITGLPAGTRYKVEEASYAREGYSAAGTGATGTISAGEEKAAEFTNTKNYYPSNDPTGSLTIRKTVKGIFGERDRQFTFVVTFDAGGFYSYSGSKSGMISSGQKILLAHDEYIKISGLPVGTTYQVTEEEANRGGYYTTSAEASGTISRDGRTAEFTNTKGINPNTGDDASGGGAAFGVAAFSVLLAGLFGLDFYLSRKNRKRRQN